MVANMPASSFSHRLLPGLLTAALLGTAGACQTKSAPETTPPQNEPRILTPEYTGADAERRRISVRLQQVADGLPQNTDIQFLPGQDDVMLVLEKEGRAVWLRPDRGDRGTLFTVDVLTRSEQGLLGLAFHPEFRTNGRFFINHVVRRDGQDVSRISEYRMTGDAGTWKAEPVQTVLEVEQPFANHNAGQLQFGPDGMLYVGFGDGGSGGDPLDHGQNTGTLLGAMLRIDVDRREDGKAYAVPGDNPFVGRDGFGPEIWAYGFRNPWRYTFAPDGRLLVADVGQNAWEEIDIVTRGGNYGWNVREGRHCFEPPENCPTAGLIDPIYEYPWGADTGRSIVGGYVVTSGDIPELQGKYVFGDFVSHRVWAIDLPSGNTAAPESVEPWALGEWPITPATFGQDAAGRLYIGDFAGGAIYRIIAP